MKIFAITAILAAFLTGAFFAPGAYAQGTTDVAVAAPTKTNTPITGQNMPVYLDKNLSNMHSHFSKFAKTKVSSLNRNHIKARSRMQIIKQPDGTFLARYHEIDVSTMDVKVSKSSSKTIPYVAVMKYHEVVMEYVGASREACRTATFTPKMLIPTRQIFSYKKGAWK